MATWTHSEYHENAYTRCLSDWSCHSSTMQMHCISALQKHNIWNAFSLFQIIYFYLTIFCATPQKMSGMWESAPYNCNKFIGSKNTILKVKPYSAKGRFSQIIFRMFFSEICTQLLYFVDTSSAIILGEVGKSEMKHRQWIVWQTNFKITSHK